MKNNPRIILSMLYINALRNCLCCVNECRISIYQLDSLFENRVDLDKQGCLYYFLHFPISLCERIKQHPSVRVLYNKHILSGS